MLITARSSTTTQRLHSFKFTLVNKSHSQHSEAAVRCLGRHFYFCTHAHTKSRSQTKDHGHWSGSETSTQAKWPAIFEFGRGFYGNTYISVLLTLTLTPTVGLPTACLFPHTGPLAHIKTWKALLHTLRMVAGRPSWRGEQLQHKNLLTTGSPT